MNVLHLNQSDIVGGAAIAAYRLHHGLRQIGVDSNLLVPNASLNEESTTVLAPMSMAERALVKLTFSLLPNNTNLLRSWKIPKMAAYQKADVVNFHNLHTGLYFNYLTIPRISREKPVVFTLHDMWSFTGHCAYSYDCERWLRGCGKCPYPDTYPTVQWDNTAIEAYLKKQVYARSKMTIVTPSQWLATLARKSILGQFPIHTIPYGIDTVSYRPIEKGESRRQLGLPEDGIVLMFGCDDPRDRRKGLDILILVLKSLPEAIKKRVVLYVIGRKSSTGPEIPEIRTVQAGYVESDEEKARGYSAADIFISTARADNLPLVLQESLACGTPMLATRVGGTEELVRHGVTGFTAPPDDLSGLTSRLIELIENTELRKEMAVRCRQVAIEEYPLKAIAQKYATLYESVAAAR